MRVLRFISTAVVIVGLSGCGMAAGSSSSSVASATPTPAPSPTAGLPTTAAPTPDPMAGWLTYHSAANHLSFRHPADWSPAECGWVFIQPGSHSPTCPQGDGFCCVFLAASDNGQTGSFSLISTNRGLYSNVQQMPATVNGVTGVRLSGTQTQGQGSGSGQMAPQIEYDFSTGGRTYHFLADVGPADSGTSGAVTAGQFDQLVQSVTFG